MTGRLTVKLGKLQVQLLRTHRQATLNGKHIVCFYPLKVEFLSSNEYERSRRSDGSNRCVPYKIDDFLLLDVVLSTLSSSVRR